tara:strand:+ start:2046 stop:2228 length:183 start_codon:yes stop_codon:yes gene_type:complete
MDNYTAVEIKNNISRYLDRINRIDHEYEEKIDKLMSKRDKELEIYWELLSREQKILQEVK